MSPGEDAQVVDDLASAAVFMSSALVERGAEDLLDVSKRSHALRDFGESLFDQLLDGATGRRFQQSGDVIQSEAGRLRRADEAQTLEVFFGIESIVRG